MPTHNINIHISIYVYTCSQRLGTAQYQVLGDSIYGDGVALVARFNRNTNLGGRHHSGSSKVVK